MTFTRRDFIKDAALLGLAVGPLSGLAQSVRTQTTGAVRGVGLHWLDGDQPSIPLGSTFGVPWSPGEIKRQDQFVLRDAAGQKIPVQTWPLAFWPDGTIKWSAFASAQAGQLSGDGLFLEKAAAIVSSGIRVLDDADSLTVDNGVLRMQFAKKGQQLLSNIWQGEKLLANDVLLKIILQDAPDTDAASTLHKKEWISHIESCRVENSGPERVLVRVDGHHRDAQQQHKFPFILRFYIYRDVPTVKVLYTFLYDGDEQSDFIKGIGLSVAVPLAQAPAYNRYVRFVGEGESVFAEAVQGLTGLRRDPGAAVRARQIDGKEIALSDIDERVRKGLPYIPKFGDYSLSQLHDAAFRVTKRTATGHSWLQAKSGKRSPGVAYLGTPDGGVALGIRNFWQSYPAQLDISEADTDEGRLTGWLWAPQAPAMDVRFYHDGMGQDTYEKQWEGLEITYEDYEEGYATAHGVGRTTELYLSFFKETPTAAQLLEHARAYQSPALLSVAPDYLFSKKVFGANWGLPDRTTEKRRALEDRLDALFTFYQKEVDRRGWYGFWNYGDVMHAYDTDRHVWRYDVGGFAWDNSELSTDLWLWYYYLRTGRADVFRMAEAMCRHTGEVDVYHLGKFAPLGSRHNVMHWGCSAKQLRISTAINRRFYYYLTADERTGDLLHEQVEGVRRLQDVVALRKRLDEPLVAQPGKVLVSFGTDWGAIAAAWFTQWERTLDPKILDRLQESMRTIADQPQGFFTGLSLFTIDSGRFECKQSRAISVSHLNAVFGLAEMVEEICMALPNRKFQEAWLAYCRLYNAPDEEKRKALGTADGKFNLRSSHARLTAFAASTLQDEALARRAWSEFSEDRTASGKTESANPVIQEADYVEWPGISTNWAAQWGLTAIQCLHFVGKYQ